MKRKLHKPWSLRCAAFAAISLAAASMASTPDVLSAEKAPTFFRSQPIVGGQAAQKVTLDVSGLKKITLSAKGYSWGQAVWGEAVLIGRDGSETKLADLKAEDVTVGWGDFTLGKGPDEKPLKVADREFAHGIFAHADSFVTYNLDGRFVRFESWIGLNHTAKKQGKVVFEIVDPVEVEWRRLVEQMKRGFTRECLASLNRELKAQQWHGGKKASHSRKLERRLNRFEMEFAELRQELEKDPQAIRKQLTAFEELVRDIHLRQLDKPLLFVKRHAYFADHIYDDYVPWHPGGGIYVLENPAAPLEKQVVRPVIDPSTPVTLGEGIYRDPDLSCDARKILFSFKGEKEGDTCIYEIGLDGQGFRRVSSPAYGSHCGEKPAGLIGAGHHDIAPCYLPGDRIAFLSTRAQGLVLCFNNFITTLHTMNGDGSNIKCISVNNVSEFDPTMLPDGRLLFGRWEYVDKTALYMQSLWTMYPDGTGETALFMNNLAKPTAVLDARPVPSSSLIVASLTPHNGQSVGAIAMIEPSLGKNNLGAIDNFTPEYPTEMDQGLKRGPCDPWPLAENVVLIANNAERHGQHSVLELIDRFGFRTVIRKEPDNGCFSPIVIAPRPEPPTRTAPVETEKPALFFVHDIYRGLEGVRRGEVKKLRVLETTTRISGVPEGGRWWNQAFLVSWQGSYDIKDVLGVVRVEEDGSALFEAPPGKALYFQALDREGRMVQSMRTFVQAVPGVTRSCTGCHMANDDGAPASLGRPPLAMHKPPQTIAPESWGRGHLDFPTMIQPILDRHCVRCHGGREDIAGGIDLSGGWTWAFNLSYETLLKNTLAGFLNCENSSVKTAEILSPRTHGSGAAPLTKLLLEGHEGRIEKISRREIDLLMAWMDGNCNYYGDWDYTEHAVCKPILPLRDKLFEQMDKAGCLKCHEKEIGSDWVNLQTPEHSRLLRAPLAKADGSPGLEWCRDQKASKPHLPLITQKQQPPDVFKPARQPAPEGKGAAAVSFKDTGDKYYQAMLAMIRDCRAEALRSPRVDMPGAKIVPGKCRDFLAPASVAGVQRSEE